MKKFDTYLVYCQNSYYKHPIIIDWTVIGLILFTICLSKSPESFLIEENELTELTSNIIAALVSLAGFILTSLTILITVNASIKSRSLEEAKSGLELLLLGKGNYKIIVSAFRDSIWELFIAVLVMYSIWIQIFPLSKLGLIYLCAYGILTLIFTVGRSLFLLFKLISQEFSIIPD